MQVNSFTAYHGYGRRPLNILIRLHIPMQVDYIT